MNPHQNFLLRFLFIFFAVMIISNLLSHFAGAPSRQTPTSNQPQLAISDLSYPEFVRYLENNRIAKIQIIISSELRAKETSVSEVIYVTTVSPNDKLALEALFLQSDAGFVKFIRNNLGISESSRKTDNQPLQNQSSPPKQLKFEILPAPEFLRRVSDGAFAEVRIAYLDQILVTLSGSAFENIRYRVRIPTTFEKPSQDLIQQILENPTRRKALVTLMLASEVVGPVSPLWLIPIFALIGVMILLLRSQLHIFGRGRDSISKFRRSTPSSRDQLRDDTPPNNQLEKPIPTETPRVTFEDIGGQDEAVADAREIVEFLTHPAKFRKIGAKIPRGALLVGPPGTGKTLLGKAIAGEAQVSFIYVGGSEFVELFVGVGAARVRDLFRKARAEAQRSRGCIIFFDEIDAIGSRRIDTDTGGAKEHNQTLNQLLTEIDGFEPNINLFVMGATNRLDMLDPALVRRLPRKIFMTLPDIKGREAILKIHMRNRNFDASVTPKEFAKRTPLGFSGDDLANAVNEAAIAAVRNGRDRITWEDVQEGINRIMMGAARKSRVLSEKEKVEVAYHEAGHHYVRWFLYKVDPAHTDPPGTVTIIGRGMALGYATALTEEERFLWDERYLKNQLTIAVAGRVAEEIFLNTRTSGAANDFEQATEIAIKMITKWVMGNREGLPPLALGRRSTGASASRGPYRDYSDETAKIIDDHAGALVREAMQAATVIIEQGREELERLVEALLEKETIEAEELDAIIAGSQPSQASETDAVIQERLAKLKEVAKWLAQPIIWPIKQIAALTQPGNNKNNKNK
jgi:cell division protease FtsH